MDFDRALNDVERENAGEWQDLVGFPGVRAFVLSANSKVFNQTAKRLRASLKIELQRGGESFATANEKVNRLSVLACVREIEGFTKNGKPYPLSEFRHRLESDDPEELARCADLLTALGIACGRAGAVDRMVLDDLGKSQPEPSAPASS